MRVPSLSTVTCQIVRISKITFNISEEHIEGGKWLCVWCKNNTLCRVTTNVWLSHAILINSSLVHHYCSTSSVTFWWWIFSVIICSAWRIVWLRTITSTLLSHLSRYDIGSIPSRAGLLHSVGYQKNNKNPSGIDKLKG